MTEYEFALRMALLVGGFLSIAGAAVLKYLAPKIEITVVLLLVFGALCVMVSTQGVGLP